MWQGQSKSTQERELSWWRFCQLLQALLVKGSLICHDKDCCRDLQGADDLYTSLKTQEYVHLTLLISVIMVFHSCQQSYNLQVIAS